MEKPIILSYQNIAVIEYYYEKIKESEKRVHVKIKIERITFFNYYERGLKSLNKSEYDILQKEISKLNDKTMTVSVEEFRDNADLPF